MVSVNITHTPHPQATQHTSSSHRVDRVRTCSPRRAVYDGQDRIGDVLERDGGFIAHNRRGEIVGTFGSLPDAANACWRIAHAQTVDVP
jgi:hypothetical protein